MEYFKAYIKFMGTTGKQRKVKHQSIFLKDCSGVGELTELAKQAATEILIQNMKSKKQRFYLEFIKAKNQIDSELIYFFDKDNSLLDITHLIPSEYLK